jgi:hypothetical protein
VWAANEETVAEGRVAPEVVVATRPSETDVNELPLEPEQAAIAPVTASRADKMQRRFRSTMGDIIGQYNAVYELKQAAVRRSGRIDRARPAT